MKSIIFFSQIKFLWSHRRSHYFPLLIFLFVGFCLLVAGIRLDTVGQFWTEVIDPFLGIAVLLIALALWFGELRQDWRQSLPCLLTVVLWFDGREMMRCEYADLASEADMRALGQTIGAQMTNNEKLKFFAPSVKQSGGDVIEFGNGEVNRHFTIEMVLRELPKSISKLPEADILVWRPPFTKDPQPEQRA